MLEKKLFRKKVGNNENTISNAVCVFKDYIDCIVPNEFKENFICQIQFKLKNIFSSIYFIFFPYYYNNFYIFCFMFFLYFLKYFFLSIIY